MLYLRNNSKQDSTADKTEKVVALTLFYSLTQTHIHNWKNHVSNTESNSGFTNYSCLAWYIPSGGKVISIAAHDALWKKNNTAMYKEAVCIVVWGYSFFQSLPPYLAKGLRFPCTLF